VSLKFLLKGQLGFIKQNGFNVIAASAYGDEVKDVESYEQCKHYSFPLTRSINPLVDIYCIVKMFLFFRNVKPTIVHSHTPKAGLLAMLSSKLANVPIRLHTIAGLPWMEETGWKKVLFKRVEKLTINASTKVYVNSNNLLSFLQKEKIISNKLALLGKGTSNGIDENYFKINSSIINEANVRSAKTHHTKDAWVWLFVGRVVKDKGIQELIDAFEELLKVFPNEQLWLVGNEEELLDPLDKAYIKKINSNKNIVKWGFQNDVRSFYCSANMLVFPSYREGFPNVPMQAALMDCGLILSNINGCNEIVTHQKNGLLVNAKDWKDLFEKMLYSRNNPQVVDSYKTQAKSFVLENFTQKKVWHNILDEYKKLINEKNL
jgi:glycosyltransferase involved in cell wall biosynthesis